MAADGAKITENGQNWTVVPPAGITEWQLERIGGTVVLTLSAGGSLVSLPTLVPASSAYTGEEQKPGYAESDAYVATFGEGNWTTAGVYAITFDLTDKEATQWTDGTTAPQFPRWRLKGLRTQNAHFAMRETHDFGIVRFTR